MDNIKVTKINGKVNIMQKTPCFQIIGNVNSTVKQLRKCSLHLNTYENIMLVSNSLNQIRNLK